MHRDVHRILVPTLWGYATLIRTSDAASRFGGTTRRVDTVLPPELSADELLEFHARLLMRPADRRRPWAAAAAVGRCALLRHAVDVRTTAALTLRLSSVAPTPHDVAFSALVRAMRRADDAHLTPTREALARQLVWCAIHAARDQRLAQVLDATHALRHLATTSNAGTATDVLDQT